MKVRRRHLVALGTALVVVSVGAGTLAACTAPSGQTSALDAHFAAAGRLPGSWSITRAPLALDVLTVPPSEQCYLPPRALFGILLVNQQYRSKGIGAQLSETIGIAGTSDVQQARRLLRQEKDVESCLSRRAPRRVATYIESEFARIQPFEDAVGWTGYCPAKSFTPDPVSYGGIISEYGFSVCGKTRWIFYTLLRDGVVANVLERGSLSPQQGAATADRLDAAL